MSDICGSIPTASSAISGKRKRKPEYVPDIVDFTSGGDGDGKLCIYDAKRTRNLPSIQLDSSESAISYFCNPSTTIDSKLGINTRTPTYNLHVVQLNSATPLVQFTLADGTTHPFSIDEMGSTTLTGTMTTINGDLNVTDTTTIVSAIDVTNNFITINSDLGVGVAPTEDCGITVNRGSSADFQFKWRESDDTFVIGLVGVSESAVATRQDSPTNGGIMVWNDSLKRCDNYSNFVFTGSRLGIQTSTAFPSPQATLHIIGEGLDDPLRVDDQTSDTTYFRIDSNGIATFGDTTEATGFDAASVVLVGSMEIAKRLFVGGTYNILGELEIDSTTSGANIISATPHIMFATDGTGKVAITNNGTVLSGAPAALLHVQYSGSESGIDCFRVDDDATTDSSYFHVEQDGRVGINCGAVQTLSPSGMKPILQVNGIQNNTGPESLATFMGPDNVTTSGISIERVSGGGIWTTTGVMISAGYHYAESDGHIVSDINLTNKHGMAIHFDTTNCITKFVGPNASTVPTAPEFVSESIDSLTLLQIEYGSALRHVHIKSTLPAVSATSAALVINGGLVTNGGTMVITGAGATGTGTSRILATTVSTGANNGAMWAERGMGISGSLYVGGNLPITSGNICTFNSCVNIGSSMTIGPNTQGASTFTFAATSNIIFMSNAGIRTVTLQACATAGVGRLIRVHEAAGTLLTITINTVNSEIIHGGGVADSTSRTITTAYGYIAMITDGTSWYVIASG